MKKIKLKDVAKIVIGISAPKKFIERNELNAVPFIRAGLLESLCNGNAEFIEFLDKLKYKTVPKNTIIFAKSGMSAFKNRVFCLKEESVIVGHLAGVICSDEVYYKYIEYYLKYNKPSKLIQNDSYPSIRTEDIENIILMLPELKEQKEISHKLDSLKNIIAIRKQQIESLEQLIKSQFVELFGDPILNNKNWKTDELNNVAPSKPYKGELDNNVWLLNLDMVESQSGRIIDYVYEDIENVGNSTCKFSEKNVLYSKLRPYLNKVVIPDKKGIATSELIPLLPEENILERYFLAYLLRSEEFVKYISEKVAGAKMPRVSMDIFRSFKVILPPIELQNQFAEFVKLIDKQKFVIVEIIMIYDIILRNILNNIMG